MNFQKSGEARLKKQHNKDDMFRQKSLAFSIKTKSKIQVYQSLDRSTKR